MKGNGWLVVAALAAWAWSSQQKRAASAAPSPRPTLNPRTGQPIVHPGTHRMTEAEVRELATQHGFADVSKAVALAMRESGGWTDVVVNTLDMSPDELHAYWGKPALPELSVGLWQINVHANPQFDAETLKDPNENAAAAWLLSQGGTSWGPWGG
jgi:hypothetical protein